MSNSYLRKILFLAANPKNSSKLRLDEELREIDEGLKRSKWRECFSLTAHWAVRMRDVYRCMLEIQPHIVHFSGHGSGKDGLVLEDKTGDLTLVQAEAFARLFKLFASKGTECIFLNACYSEQQANLISEHIPYVIGMQKTINDKSAIAFSVAFYDALGAGEGYDFAFELGCSQLIGLKESETPMFLSHFSKKNDLVKCSKNPKALANITYEFVLTGNIDEISKHKLEAIVDHLQKITEDISLTLLEVKEGSIKLILESSEASYHLLKYLVVSGELEQVLGIPVREIKRQNLETHKAHKVRVKQFFAASNHSVLQGKEQVLGLVVELEQLCQSLDLDEVVAISQLKQQIQLININLILLGSFGSGKSTLLNALAGNEIIPQSSLQNNFFNTLKWGGLEITECPRINVADAINDQSISREFLLRADGVIYMMRSDAALSVSDLHFIENILFSSFGKENIFIVFSMFNRVSPSELERLKNHLYYEMTEFYSDYENDHSQIFLIGLDAVRQKRNENDEALFKDSEIDIFSQQLMAFGQRKFSLKLTVFVRRIQEILNHLIQKTLEQMHRLDTYGDEYLKLINDSSNPELIKSLRNELTTISRQKMEGTEALQAFDLIKKKLDKIALV